MSVKHALTCLMCRLQGDSSDYELIKHQLTDPDIKASIDLNGYFRVLMLKIVFRSMLTPFSAIIVLVSQSSSIMK